MHGETIKIKKKHTGALLVARQEASTGGNAEKTKYSIFMASA